MAWHGRVSRLWQVRYVIDFYQGAADPRKPASIHLDVRPAVSFAGIFDRMRMQLFGPPSVSVVDSSSGTSPHAHPKDTPPVSSDKR